MSLLQSEQDALIRAAIDVQQRAYAPYSRFRVGAAALSESGKVFVGCNVENASYGLAICAERSALVTMVSAGHQKLRAMCIVSRGGASPCGACRQFINEFGRDAELLLFDSSRVDSSQVEASQSETSSSAGLAEGGELLRPKRIVIASELLPDSFGPQDLSD